MHLTNENPMHDFFNVYLPSQARGEAMNVQTKHKAYFDQLSSMPKYLERAKVSSRAGVRRIIERQVKGFSRHVSEMAVHKIVFQHMYSQAMDARLYQLNQPSGGWCLGMSAYWLKNKRHGINVFPNTVYNDEELSKLTGAPIKLMENQKKMLNLEKGLVNIGDTSMGSKNGLDYIAGGRASNSAPVVNFNMSANPMQIKAESKRFYRALAPRRADPSERRMDLFLIGFAGKKWGKHMMAIDMNAVEFFDPNCGVMVPANKSRQALVDFLFMAFFPIFYARVAVTSFKLYRIS